MYQEKKSVAVSSCHYATHSCLKHGLLRFQHRHEVVVIIWANWGKSFYPSLTSDCLPKSTAPTQSSKVSGSPIKRLTRKDRSRRGQEGASDHKRGDKPHVSFSDGTSACSSRSTCHTTLTGPALTLRRQTLLCEDELDPAPSDSISRSCSWPDLSTDASVCGSRSVLLQQTADRESPPISTSCPRG